MTSFERLSHWMAEVGSQGFEQFTEAYTWVSDSRRAGTAHAALRSLSALGYAEIDWRRRRWGAVAPCLTLLPDAAGHGLIVGARTERLMRELEDRIALLDADVTRHPQQRAPDAVFVAADSEAELASVAAALEMPYEHSLVERLVAVLPDIDAELAARKTPPIVRHYGVERYDLDDVPAWQPSADDRRSGLYRYERSGPRAIHFVDDDGGRYDVDQAVGAWAEARRLGAGTHLWWRAEDINGTLDVPRNLPLPTLHARAASLCSGLAAEFDPVDGCFLYPNVPEWVARRIAKALSQDLEVT